MALFPLARTPMEEKGAMAMRNYQRRLERAFDALTPWLGRTRVPRHPGVKSGEVVVMLDTDDNPKDPLYKGAKFAR